jgi:hypothetical protein
MFGKRMFPLRAGSCIHTAGPPLAPSLSWVLAGNPEPSAINNSLCHILECFLAKVGRLLLLINMFCPPEGSKDPC